MRSTLAVKPAELEISLMLEETERHLRDANACQKTSRERGWTEGATYSLAGYHLPGRALLVAIIGEGGHAMAKKRNLAHCPQKTLEIEGFAAWAERAGLEDEAAMLRDLAEKIEGPDNITVSDAVDALLDVRSILQHA